MMNSTPERDVALEDLNEAQRLLDIASEVIVRAVASKGHLAAVGRR